MGRRRWSNQFKDLRGRWRDNKKVVGQIIADARDGRDWTPRIKKFLTDESHRVVSKSHRYRNSPDLRHISFDDYDLSGVTFEHVNLQSCTAFRTEATELDISNSRMDQSKWERAKLTSARLTDSYMKRANFSHSELHNVDFSGSDLRHASFRNAELTDVSFAGADLRYAQMSKCVLENVDFSKAKLFGVSLWESRGVTAASEVDISDDGDGSVITTEVRLAPLMDAILSLRDFAPLIAAIKTNTIAILGKDHDEPSRHILDDIAAKCRQHGLAPVIVREQGQAPGEGFLRKAVTYCLLARAVIIENSSASGHIAEFPQVLEKGCIVACLQRNGHGSTWSLEDRFLIYPNTLKRFWYDPETLGQATKDALNWLDGAIEAYSSRLAASYADLDLSVPITSTEGAKRDGD